MSIRVAYRGGAECWYRIDARGDTYIFPGHLTLHDAISWINEGNRGVSPGRQQRTAARGRRRKA